MAIRQARRHALLSWSSSPLSRVRQAHDLDLDGDMDILINTYT